MTTFECLICGYEIDDWMWFEDPSQAKKVMMAHMETHKEVVVYEDVPANKVYFKLSGMVPVEERAPDIPDLNNGKTYLKSTDVPSDIDAERRSGDWRTFRNRLVLSSVICWTIGVLCALLPSTYASGNGDIAFCMLVTLVVVSVFEFTMIADIKEIYDRNLYVYLSDGRAVFLCPKCYEEHCYKVRKLYAQDEDGYGR